MCLRPLHESTAGYSVQNIPLESAHTNSGYELIWFWNNCCRSIIFVFLQISVLFFLNHLEFTNYYFDLKFMQFNRSRTRLTARTRLIRDWTALNNFSEFAQKY